MAHGDFHPENYPDRIDHRDLSLVLHEEVHSLSANAPVPGTGWSSPSSEPFFLDDLPPVYHQLKIGSCTANAVAAALRFAYRKLTGSKYEEFEPSRLWIYYQARILANLPGLSDANEDPDDAGDLSLLIRKDTGCSSRSAVKCLLDQGVCMEEFWPYGSPSSDADSGLFHDVDTTPNPCAPTDLEKATFQAKLISLANTTPQTTKGILQDSQGPPNMRIAFARIFDEAAKARIENPAKMTDSDWQMIYDQPAVVLLEQNLRDGFPFIFTTQLVLGARFNKHEIGQDAVWVKPPIENAITRGRHTMLAVGFDPGRRLFLVQNSWGPKWPLSYSGSDERLRGRFWMPYEWFEAAVDGKPLTYDFWVPCTIPS